MNFGPWRKKRVPRPRARCQSCGQTVAVAARLSGEELIELIQQGERIPVHPHSCDHGLDDTVQLDFDQTVVQPAPRPPRRFPRA